MIGLAAVRALGPADLRTVWRDPMLRWLALLPLALALVARWFLRRSSPGWRCGSATTWAPPRCRWWATSC